MSAEDILKSDIFFLVATIATAVVALVVTIFGVYAIKIARDARSLLRDIKYRYRFMENFIRKIIKK